MGVYLSTASKEKFSSDGSVGKVTYGASSMQGWRKSQEDSHNCCPDFDPETNTLLFSVYDGHGGAEVAEFSSRHLPDFIKQNKLYKLNKVSEALIDSFLEFDASLIGEEAQKELASIAQLDKVDSADEDETVMLNEEAEMPIEKVLENYGGVQQLPEDVKNVYQKNMKFQKNDNQTYESPALKAKCNGSEQKKLDEIKSNLDKKLSNGHLDENDNGKCGKVESTTADEETVASKKAETVEDGVSSSDDAVTADMKVVNGTDNEATPVVISKSKPKPSAHKEEKEDSAEPSSSNIPNEDEDDEDYNDACGEEEEVWSDTSSEDGEDGEDDEEDEDDCCHGDDQMAATFNDEKPGYDSGCTAVVALLRDRVLHVANAGDSRCVLCRRGGKAFDMSVDHKPEDEPELSRIKRAGGIVSYDGRVNGGLNLSRALGDHVYKGNEKLELKDQMISGLPDVQIADIQDDDEFMIIACDGIWNSMTSQEVVDFVKERIDRGVTKMSTICEQLFDNCLAPDTSGDGTGCDNMTAVIVRFDDVVAARHHHDDDNNVTSNNDVSNNKGLKRSAVDSAEASRNADDGADDVTTSSSSSSKRVKLTSLSVGTDVPESTDSSTG